MSWHRRDRGYRMPDKFEPLARYNAECSRGVIHTADYAERMGALQDEFNAWSRSTLQSDAIFVGPQPDPGTVNPVISERGPVDRRVRG